MILALLLAISVIFSDNFSQQYSSSNIELIANILNVNLIQDIDIKYINKNNPGKDENKSISEVLGNETITNELEAFIVGLNHQEQVKINSTQGGNRKKITITGNGLFIINVAYDVISDIIIENIEMVQWKGGFIKSEGGNSISLIYCLFNVGGAVVHNYNIKLEITLCEFKGDGQYTDIDPFIAAKEGIINIINSTFRQGSFYGQDKGCIVCRFNCQQCLIEGSEFNSSKLGSYSASVSISSSSCTLLQIKGSQLKRTIFSGLGINDSLSGNFVKSIAIKIDISFSDFIYATFINNGNALFIINSQQSYNSSIIREVSISDCIFKYLRGQENCGSIIIDIQTKFTLSFNQNFFSENVGRYANDIQIHTINETDLTYSNFTNSFSDSLKPHILITQESISTFYNLTIFEASRFVTLNKINKDYYQSINDAINDLNNDTTSPLYYPRSIYILDETWNESIINICLTGPLVIKSGFENDNNGMRLKPTWTTESDFPIIYFISGDLTLESIQFKFQLFNNSITPLNVLVVASGIYSTNLTIVQCTFTGLGNETIVGYFINSINLNSIILKDCLFLSAKSEYYYINYIFAQSNHSYFLLQNCSFINIIITDFIGKGTLTIDGHGLYFKIQIIGCLFENCSCLNSLYSGAVSITSQNNNDELVIHESRFINNIGFISGAIYLNISSTNCRFFDNEFSNNSRIGENQTGNDAYLYWSQIPSSFIDINITEKIQQMFIGSISNTNDSIYYIISNKYQGSIDLNQPLITRFVDQNASEGGTGEKNKPLKSINKAFNGTLRKTDIYINILNTLHYENIIIDDTIVWKSIHIKAEVEGGTTMFRDNDESENTAIIYMTLNSITPTTLQNVIMNVSSGFFVIQKSKKAILTLQNILFINNGTIQQDGSSLLHIDQCSFHTIDDKFKSNSFVSSLQGLLQIINCLFGTNSITNMRNSAIISSSLCTDISISQSNFTNLHSDMEGKGTSSSGIVIIVGNQTHVSINECIFYNCTDSGNDNAISSGAILIIAKSSNLKKISSIKQIPSYNPSFKYIFNTKEHNNNNFGDVFITNNQFSYCSGNNVGGIFFGDNVIQISAQNNTFTNNSHPLQTVNGSADIFFSSKILLDQSGGIVEVCKGYKCSFDSKQKPTGEVKIDGFSSNFASYLNCISQGGYKCEDLPCGGELYIKPEECPYQDEKDGKSISIATIIGIVVGALVGVTTVIIIVIIIMVIQKKKRLRGLTNSDDPELLALILSNPVDFSDLSNTRNSQLQLLMSDEFQQIAVD